MTSRNFARAIVPVVPVLLVAAALAGCDAAPRSAPAAAVTSAVATAATTAAPTAIPFDLYTHCGIDEALVGSTYFEAETPLSGGAFNPPPGWDNPVQRGTMTLISPTEAVFTDAAGHEVRFRARVGAHEFKRVCM
ncbi:hypothetical protein [Streptomyces sp. NPDC026673]|uniref:hypothetical protein n=1 Tax=Streptomyces sp. NPDC026673 TaxID=3155724 RepID=UPI0033ECE3FE